MPTGVPHGRRLEPSVKKTVGITFRTHTLIYPSHLELVQVPDARQAPVFVGADWHEDKLLRE